MDESLTQALELFNIPGAVNISLRAQATIKAEEEVCCEQFAGFHKF